MINIITILKSNHLLDDSNGLNAYCRADSLDWSPEDIRNAKIIKIHKFPKNHKVKLCRVTVSTNRTDYVITNDMAQKSFDAVEKSMDLDGN